MARPLRIEFPGALYHITSRGDRREPIFADDKDREKFLVTLAEVVKRFNWLCYAYCLMTNHYHLMIETPEANLSKGMRLLNGMYTQAYNRRHRQVGHLFQGRFKSILVDRDAYLVELSRYVVLNPVRAGMVKDSKSYRWSSYRATVGEVAVPTWLGADVLLAHFGKKRVDARRRYSQFVREGLRQESIWVDLRQQIYLGDEKFVRQMQKNSELQGDELTVPQVQRRTPPPSLDVITGKYRSRNDAIVAAYNSGAYSYREIAEYFGLHLATIGRIVRAGMPRYEN